MEASAYEESVGPHFALRFYGVTQKDAINPEDMILYAVSEMRCDPPLRKFSFANSEDDEARLVITAAGFDVVYGLFPRPAANPC